MSKISTMEELFIEEIRDLYDAEKQLTKALPKMAKAAISKELRDALDEHLGQTENQIARLERIFALVGEDAKGRKCAAMSGLIKEGEELVEHSKQTPVRDAGLIAAAQKVEHYEISGYGSARTHAELLGNDEAARLLDETLLEEKQADTRLTQLAEGMINTEAAEVAEDGGTRIPTSLRDAAITRRH